MQNTKQLSASLVDKNSLISLYFAEGNSDEKRCQTWAMIQVNTTFQESNVAAVVFACNQRLYRHLDLCGMFDRSLCRKVFAVYVLKRIGTIAAHDILVQC